MHCHAIITPLTHPLDSNRFTNATTSTVLIRAGFQVTSVGINLKNQYATCTRNVKIVPDTTDLPSEPVTDILILPGGGPGADTFVSSSPVQHLVRAYRDAGKHVALICAGTLALVASVKGAGKTEGLESAKTARVTSHPSVKKEIEDAGWEYADESERVVISGHVITSRGPGTAMEFALTIVEVLAGKDKRREVAGPMLPPDVL